jgi:hypothetical protein
MIILKGWCVTKSELTTQDIEEVFTVGFAMVSIEILFAGNDRWYCVALVVGHIIAIKLYFDESCCEIEKLYWQMTTLEIQQCRLEWIECIYKKRQLLISALISVLFYLCSRVLLTLSGLIFDCMISYLLQETCKFFTICVLGILFRVRDPIVLFLGETSDGHLRIIQSHIENSHHGVALINVDCGKTSAVYIFD